MAMAASTKKSSGADPVMGAIGGILPGVGAMTQVSQMASDPKGAAKGMGEQMAKEAMKKAAKKIAQKVAQQIAASVLTNPYVLAAIGIVIVVVVVFLIIIGAISGQSNPSTSGASPLPAPPPSVYTFVALGDSLTAWPNGKLNYTPNGTPNPETNNDNSGTPWPSQLAANDQSLSLLKNAGVPAETTTQILSRFQSDVAVNKPEVLFLQGGTNDYGKSIDTIGNLKAIIADAQNAGIKYVVLLTITHQCSGSTNESQSSLNTPIKNLASSYVTVIDVASVLSCSSTPVEYQSDGIHYTAVGAQKIADYIDGQIKSRGLLPSKGQAPSRAFFCQWDNKWKDQVYDDGTIQTTGCGPTSMAMILSSYGGKTYTPGDVATMFHAQKYDYLPGSGDHGTNNWLIASSWLSSIGFKRASADIVNDWTKDIYLNTQQLQQIKDYADGGWLMLAATDGKTLPTYVGGGHTVVIETADPQANTVTIRDPYDKHCVSGETVTVDAKKVGWWLITPVKIN